MSKIELKSMQYSHPIFAEFDTLKESEPIFRRREVITQAINTYSSLLTIEMHLEKYITR